ncbi:arsenic resistance protein [Mycoplasmatota bacterium]|nr:arsenic resistance protein [Mycoplasmatota bacterium]
MKSLSNIIKKNFIPLVFLSTIVGLSVGQFFNVAPLKSYIPYTLFIIVFPMFLNVKFLDVIELLKRPFPVVIGILINVIAIPLYSNFLGKLFFNSNPELFMGFLLIGLISSGAMTASWTGFANGNVKSAVLMMSINLLISILLIPIYLNLFMGTIIRVDNNLIFASLFKSVIMPLIIANVVRYLINRVKTEEFLNDLKSTFSLISSLGLFTVIFITLALKSRIILNDLQFTLSLFLPLLIFYTGIVIVCHIIGKRLLSKSDSIAFVYSVVLRNLKIALVIALSISSDSMASLIISLAILVQHLLSAMYMNYVNTKISPELL